ncbi:cytochrome P450 [Colletotrichum falcatum]|nr:cytochrome P450 [Colletotrichum falcatum]
MSTDFEEASLVTWTIGSGLFILLFALFFVRRLGHLDMDPREPPLLQPKVPIVGHVVSMWLHGGGYYLELYRKSGGVARAATLNILGQKFYVIFSPNLAQSAFRNRFLTAERFTIQSATGVVGLSGKGKQILEHGTLLQEFYREVPLALLSTESLSKMASTTLSTLTLDLGQLAAVSHGYTQLIPDLFGFLRHRLALATTDGLYGANANPLRSDPSLTDDVWTFDEAMFRLFFNVAPKLIAPAGHQARKRLQRVLISYFQDHPDNDAFPNDAAEIVRMRARIVRAAGFCDEDLGNMEIGMIHAALHNTAPILFWLVVNVFARPQVLASVRAEVEKLVEFDTPAEPSSQQPARRAILHASRVTDQNLCPYTAAVHREILRLCDSVTVTRFVDEDTTLSDGTLLRAGSLVHLPSAVAHRMPEVWGNHDSDVFEPGRMLDPDGKASAMSDRKKAYWPFGAGKHLCPGRKFALAENLTFVAALAVGFDIEGLDEKIVPHCPIANLMGQSVAKPENTVAVTVRRRRGWELSTWQLLA